MSFDSFSTYQLDTPNMLGGQNAQSSHDNFQLSPYDTCQVPGMIQYQMDMQQDLEEDEEPKSNTRPKLGYKRASSACSKQGSPPLAFGLYAHPSNISPEQCRHRKIRCIASSSDAQARCVSCVRLKKECSSYLTGRSSADGSDLIRVARFSPSTDESSDAYDLAQTSASMEQYLDMQKPPLDSSKTRPTASVAPIGNGIPWVDGFGSGMRVSTVEGQVNLNMRSQSLPEWDPAVMGQVSNANAVDFDSSQRGQLSEVPAISQFPTSVDMSIPSTSSIPQHANPLSQPDLNFPWGSNSYALPIRSLSGLPETVNIGNMVHVGGEALFDFQSSPSPSTNQPLPLQISLAAQGRSQSLPYNGYTFDSFWE
ncbi:uncharacterized protein FTJAE_977 [Fusarium tjaetaba]|uniref:Zn(2)-C6 fungal-type domain-containing protein n=1 Tax=Fusarium tjaetaba TaxID=1567544 RepID=A0A8H5S9Z9_9HYPO|nr:uncharacterized protein FTJAE_977 [Fusarium tjaetaba]KAF5649540.1 hypothetical protein FTJAE_977 [Fusarium tjaetaba]